MSEKVTCPYCGCEMQPENRVLTFEELCKLDDSTPIWNEYRYLKKMGNYLEAGFRKKQFMGAVVGPIYGETVRCWLRKPTEEERKAVKWE